MMSATITKQSSSSSRDKTHNTLRKEYKLTKTYHISVTVINVEKNKANERSEGLGFEKAHKNNLPCQKDGKRFALTVYHNPGHFDG